MNNILEIHKHLNQVNSEITKLRNEVKEKDEIINKLKTKNDNFFSEEILYNDVKKLEGKNIENVAVFSAEYGRTYSTYIGFKCSDGVRILIAGTGSLYSPSPEIEDMKKSEFYTESEIKKVSDYIKARKEQKKREEKERKEAAIKRLQEELSGNGS